MSLPDGLPPALNPLTLGQLRQTLALTESDVNHVLRRAFEFWPTPGDDKPLTEVQLALLWTVDTLAKLGVLEPTVGATAAEQLYATTADILDPDNPEHYDRLTLRIADRIWMSTPYGMLNLNTGQIQFLDPNPLPRFTEKAIYDVGHIYRCRRRTTT